MRAPRAAHAPLAVDAERRLTVGADRNDTNPAVGAPDTLKEFPDRCASLIPLPPRRHAIGAVFPQEGDKAVNVGGLPGMHVSIQQRALLGIMIRRFRRAASGLSTGHPPSAAL